MATATLLHTSSGFPGTPQAAIVHAVLEFMWGMLDEMNYSGGGRTRSHLPAATGAVHRRAQANRGARRAMHGGLRRGWLEALGVSECERYFSGGEGVKCSETSLTAGT